MSITEQQRHDLHSWLEETMGEDRAATLMGYLPPVGWANVATKTDLDHLRAVTKADIDHLQAVTKADIERLVTKIEATEARVLGTMHKEFASMTRTLLVVIVGAIAAVVAAATGF